MYMFVWYIKYLCMLWFYLEQQGSFHGEHQLV